jgi:hypothetical protein
MAYGQEEQLPQETHYEVMVDESTGAATVSFTLSREEVERRIREVERDAEDS